MQTSLLIQLKEIVNAHVKDSVPDFHNFSSEAEEEFFDFTMEVGGFVTGISTSVLKEKECSKALEYQYQLEESLKQGKAFITSNENSQLAEYWTNIENQIQILLSLK